MTIEEITGLSRVIPVVVVADAEEAVPLAETLVRRGMPAIEITLRTPAALEAIEYAAAVPGAVVGAGTVTSPAQAEAALDAGARFLVSPGTTSPLLDALQASGVPFLPGAATPSEMLALLERGITHAKFFPAEASGGVPAVKALAGPFPQLRLCPTGGIDENRAGRYLAQPNVACVGGSWMLRAQPGSPAAPESRRRSGLTARRS
jgi:2-dehydro-3-deoxyphosphogluconate aldolase/(4S)-4-hydroxy-2-oxoglutarate aldolase